MFARAPRDVQEQLELVRRQALVVKKLLTRILREQPDVLSLAEAKIVWDSVDKTVGLAEKAAAPSAICVRHSTRAPDTSDEYRQIRPDLNSFSYSGCEIFTSIHKL